MTTARENAFDNTVVPGAEYAKSALFKIHFWNGGTPDESKAQQGFFDRLVNRKFPKFGADGKGAGETSVAAELGYLAANISVIVGEVRGALHKTVPWFGYDGKAQPEGQRQVTNLATFLAYSDFNQAKLEAKLDAVILGLGNLKPELQQVMQDEFRRSLGEGLGTYEVKLVPKEGGK